MLFFRNKRKNFLSGKVPLSFGGIFLERLFLSLRWLWDGPSRFFVVLIRGYQGLLSPDHSWWAKALNKPPFCKHYPSCSSYSIEALQKHGAIKGGFFSIRRILSCNPWSKGGYDPVPPSSSSQPKSHV